MPTKPRRFSQEVKLAVVRRMLAGENVTALSRQLNILRKDLYKWQADFLSGGMWALRGPGRPRQLVDADASCCCIADRTSEGTSSHRRIGAQSRAAADGARLFSPRLAAAQRTTPAQRGAWRQIVHALIAALNGTAAMPRKGKLARPQSLRRAARPVFRDR